MNVTPDLTVKLPAGLYLVATPIGNLGDITVRALEILRACDRIACEDTRVTGKLLHLLGLPKKPLIVYNDHSDDRRRDELLAAVAGGMAVALVGDAGMPLISDPGYKLVRACVDAGLMVTTLPGASAPLAALQLSGLPSDRFTFLGFLPPKSAARRDVLEKMRSIPVTLVFFESGPRLPAMLADCADILGDRSAAVARELTKLYEEVRRGTTRSLADFYAESPKGELVVVIAGAADDALAAADIEAQLRAALRTSSVRDAAAMVAEATGTPRKKVYALALTLAAE